MTTALLNPATNVWTFSGVMDSVRPEISVGVTLTGSNVRSFEGSGIAGSDLQYPIDKPGTLGSGVTARPHLYRFLARSGLCDSAATRLGWGSCQGTAIVGLGTAAVMPSDQQFAGVDLLKTLVGFWRSQTSKAEKALSSLLRSSANDDTDIDVLKSLLADLLRRHGEVAVRVIAQRLMSDEVSADLRHDFFVELGRLDDSETHTSRRVFLSEALRSTDASVRYSAAVALGLMRSDKLVKDALTDRSKHEANRSVKKMIAAQLA